MKKFLLSLVALVTLFLPSLAEEKSIVLKASNFNLTSSYSGCTYSDAESGFTFGVVGIVSSSNLCMNKSKGCQFVVTKNENSYLIKTLKINFATALTTATFDVYSSSTAYTTPKKGSTNATLSGDNVLTLSQEENSEGGTATINNTFAGFCYSSGSGQVQISSIEIVYDVVTVYPTSCNTPTFSIDGSVITENSLSIYAGKTISVACDSKGSSINWTVTNNGETTNITGEQFTIPSDAKTDDTYIFKATGSVQGEKDIIKSEEATLTVTIAKAPLYGLFYTGAYKGEIPEFATKLTNASSATTANTATTALCAVEGGFNSNLANISFNNTKGSNFAYVNSNNTIALYPNNEFTVSVPNGYEITSIDFYTNSTSDSANLKYLIGNNKAVVTLEENGYWGASWTSAEDENSNSVTFKFTSSSKWSNTYGINGIKVSYAAVAPEAPEIHEDCTAVENGILTAETDSYTLKFTEVEGIDIYYKLLNTLADENDDTVADDTVDNSSNDSDATEDDNNGADNDNNVADSEEADDALTIISSKAVEHTDFTKYVAEEGILLTSDVKRVVYYAYNESTDLKSAENTIRIELSNSTTGIAEIETANDSIEYYNLQGLRVANPQNGIFILKNNGKTSKVIIK